MTDLSKGLVCPDCGGVIGALDQQDVPCRCHSTDASWSRPKSAAVNMQEVDPSEDTDVVSPSAPATGGSKKVCCVCGKDLAGHRRFKDSTGYYCKDCHKADKAANHVEEKRCDACGRKFPIAKLIPWADEQVCTTCLKERQAQRKKEIDKAQIAHIRRNHEYNGLKVLAAVTLLLGLILLLHHWGIL